MLKRFVIGWAVLATAGLLLPDAASAQEQIPATVTVGADRSVQVGPQSHGAGKRGAIPPGWTVRQEKPGFQFLEVDGQSVGMAMSGAAEGQLNRIHVDAPAGTDLSIVIGFYDKIASPDALKNENTYECLRCQTLIVCSVSPQCAE